MSILSKLKEAVVEDDPPTNNNVAPVKTTPAPIPFVTGLSTGAAIAPEQIQTSDSLRVKVAGAGPATVFAATLKSLASYIPDEASRYKAAKDMLSAQGLTPSAVATDINGILGRLDTEGNNFEAAKSRKESADVTTRESRITEIDNQINQLNAERGSVAIALVTAKKNIENTKQSFYASLTAVRSEFQDMLSKVKSYVGVQ